VIISFLILIGVIFGSFSNAFIYRHKRGESVSEGRSQCDHCKTQLTWKDLIPLLSWLSLGGKCRYCKEKLSIIHPLFEASMAAVLVVGYLIWPHPIFTGFEVGLLILWLAILMNLAVLSMYDLLYKEIPIISQKINLILSMLFISLSVHLDYSIVSKPWLSIVGGLLLFGLFWAVYQISKGKWIGGADVYLVGPFGLILGPILGFTSIVLASYVALAFIILGMTKFKDRQIPFGPFLSAGFVLAYVYGEQLLDFVVRV